MRRRSSPGAGAAARAVLLAVDREVVERYGHLMHQEQHGRATATIDRLDNGEQVGSIPGWRINAWVSGIDPWAFYRLGTDDSIISL